MDDRQTLLAEIGRVSFSLNDLALYLDTHPDDQNALDYFGELQMRRKESLEAFAADHYPLVLDCAGDDQQTWTWGDAPPPWEVESNVEL